MPISPVNIQASLHISGFGIHEFIPTENQKECFPFTRIQRVSCMHPSTPFYTGTSASAPLVICGVLEPVPCGYWGADVAKFLGEPKVLHKFSTALGSAPLTSVLFNCNRVCAPSGRTEHSASGNLPKRGQDSLVNLLGWRCSIHYKPILLNHRSVQISLFVKRKWIKNTCVCVNLLCQVRSGSPGACASAGHALPRPTLTLGKDKVSSALLNFSEQRISAIADFIAASWMHLLLRHLEAKFRRPVKFRKARKMES